MGVNSVKYKIQQGTSTTLLQRHFLIKQFRSAFNSWLNEMRTREKTSGQHLVLTVMTLESTGGYRSLNGAKMVRAQSVGVGQDGGS